MKPNLVDRIIGWFAPQRALRRMRARALIEMFSQHYDAASSGRRTDGWRRSSSDANAAIRRSLPALREHSRDVIRNNGWARRGRRVVVNNTVGRGILAKPVATNEAVAQEAARLWAEWSSSLQSDFDGRHKFTGLQELILQTVFEAGGVLVVAEPARVRDNLPVPIRLRVLEPDLLDTTRDGQRTESGQIVQGIELDGEGRRIAYHLFREHPGNSRNLGGLTSVRIPANRVIHVFGVERPGQIRGVPWMAASIGGLHDLDDFEDAALMQQKIAACFGAFVRDVDGQATPIGKVEKETPEIESLEPGMVEHLPPGRDITFARPPEHKDESFTNRYLRKIAADFGITFEDLTGDYSNSNFSSARMARLQHMAHIDAIRWHMLIPHLCDGVWGWVMSLAAAMRGWPEVPTAEWTPPPAPIIDPESEPLAMQRMVRSGFKLWEDTVRERGGDPSRQRDRIAREQAAFRELGIVIDSDPGRTTAAGILQVPPDDG